MHARGDRWTQRVIHWDVTVLVAGEPGVFDENRALLPLEDDSVAVISDTRRFVDRPRLAEVDDRSANAGIAPLTQRARGAL